MSSPIPNLEFIQVIWSNIGADLMPVDHVVALLVEVTHRSRTVTLVETAIDLLSCEAQARHHRIGGLKHVGR